MLICSRAGKEPVTWSSERKLVAKRIHGDWSERNLGHTMLRFGIRNPNGGVGDVQLVLPHGQKFLVDPEASLRENANDVAQELRTVPLMGSGLKLSKVVPCSHMIRLPSY